MQFIYKFVAMGSVATAEPGKIYVDVGNGFEPGLLDHHHLLAPEKCAAALVLNTPEYVRSQVLSNPSPVQIITHLYPDMDAISGVYFARAYLQHQGPNLPQQSALSRWADYVCAVDRGETVLNPAQPITPYSVFMMSLHRAQQTHSESVPASAAMLEAGLALIDVVIAKLIAGQDMLMPDFWDDILPTEVAAVRDDHQRYLNDIQRAEQFECILPATNGKEVKKVPALWINQPSAILFKAWARGDARRADHKIGFVFTGVQLTPQRAILSVMPDSGVNLKGLGAALEKAEKAKREQIGQVRTGTNRPGYDSPDPWYDGRSPLHAYTIVDAPHGGSVLTEPEIRRVFEQWCIFR